MNERHERFRQTMRGLGARCINGCEGPDTQPNTSRLEFWGVPGKGLLVAQLWNDGGVTTYVDWPTGSTWEDLQGLLTATEQAKQPDNEDAQEIRNELESRHADSEQLGRMASAINAALPNFQTAMGSECDHAEVAMKELIEQRIDLLAMCERLTPLVVYHASDEIKLRLGKLIARAKGWK